MAQAKASITGLSQGVRPSRRTANRARTAVVVRASAEGEAAAQAGRRAVLGLVATGIVGGALSQSVPVHAETVKTIKFGAQPPPSGGLLYGTAGTENSDQARDFGLPLDGLKERFRLQSLPPAARVKRSAQEILKELTGKGGNFSTIDDQPALCLTEEMLRYNPKCARRSSGQGLDGR